VSGEGRENAPGETELSGGEFEVLPGGVAISALAHRAEEGGMNIARIPLDASRTLVVSIPRRGNTIDFVRLALDRARNGADRGPIYMETE
jgi:hypothetical protein